jgi:predicted enzyme related to lactoylglutathione lyase
MSAQLKEATMNPFDWVEIPVKDMARAKFFYEIVFGLQISVDKMGPLDMGFIPMDDSAYGVAGSLVKGEDYIPSHAGILVYFGVPDVEPVLERIKQNGGKVLMPKTSIGEYGFIARFEDCEGNMVALHSMK